MGKHIFWQMKQKSMFGGIPELCNGSELMGWVHPPMLIIVNLHLWFDQLLTRDTTIHKTSPRLLQGQQRPDKERSHKLGCYHPIHHIHQVILYYNKKLHNCEFEISKLQTKNYSQTVETTWTNKSWLIMMLVRLEVWAGQNLQSDKQNELELAHAGSNLITPIAHLAPSGVAPQVEPQGWDLQTHGYVTLYDLTHL